MKDLAEHKKIAVLIDADNAQSAKIKDVLNEISVHGHIVIKRAYGDWSSDNLKNWKKLLNELAIQPIQQFAYTTGKNSTDASMIIDAMDLLYSNKFDAFVLVSSDSDFTKLASRLRESERFVFGVGEKKTPLSFRNACDDFIFTENLGVEAGMVSGVADPSKEGALVVVKQSPKESVPLFNVAWEKCQDNGGWSNLSDAANFIKRLEPDFDPRTYGAKKFADLLQGLGSYFEVVKLQGKGTAVLMRYRPKQALENAVKAKKAPQSRPSTAKKKVAIAN